MEILIVDDHRLFRDGLKLSLTQGIENVNVIEAANAEDALALTGDYDFDLALLDFNMPSKNGIDLLIDIKAATPELPVVIMSASQSAPMIQTALKSGASGFLPKVLEPEDIIGAIRLIFSGRIYVPPFILEKLDEDVSAYEDREKASDDLVHLAQVAQRVIQENNWSIRAKPCANEQSAISTFNTMLEKMEDKYNELKHFAFHDALTELPNRRLFMDRLQQAMNNTVRNGTPIALFMMDLDGFKEINDTYGHDVGDEYLSSVSQRLQVDTRRIDTVSRLGGDEFALIVTEISVIEDVTTTAKRVIENVCQEVVINHVSIMPSVSIGIAISTDGMSVTQMIKNADIALYRVKRSGKGSFSIFDPCI